MQTYDCIKEFNDNLKRYSYKTNLYTETHHSLKYYNYTVKSSNSARWYNIGRSIFPNFLADKSVKPKYSFHTKDMEEFIRDEQLKEHDINLRYEELLLMSL